MDRSEALPATALDAENPWPGLESFHERDTTFFRGRGAAAEELLRLVRRERLTVLYSVSGLGKSSLLQAGLFPRLRAERMLPVYRRLVHEEGSGSLREQVLEALGQAVAESGVEAPPVAPGDTLWEHFHRQGAGYWSPDNLPVVPVIVLDQFEEVFTLGRQTQERAERTAAFLEELGDLIEGRAPTSVRTRLESDPDTGGRPGWQRPSPQRRGTRAAHRALDAEPHRAGDGGGAERGCGGR